MVTCTGHVGIHEGADGSTDGRTMYVRTEVHDVMAIKPNFLTSMGYHIFLTMVLRARAPKATPLMTGKSLEVAPSKQTVLCMSWRKEVMIARSFGVQPIFWRILKSSLLLTKSKAFVRSTKARNNSCCCS